MALCTLISAFEISSIWADINVTFDGTFEFGIFGAWREEYDPWGNAGMPSEIIPGVGGAGKAQGLRVYDGSGFLVKTLAGLIAGQDYVTSAWVRTARGDGFSTTPVGWVEFGWDPQARNTTQPNSNLIWCTAPGFDYAHNVGHWVQYTGEPFTAMSTSVTIALNVGTNDPKGIVGMFDELLIGSYSLPLIRYHFPDTFDSTYTLGAAYGWSKRFLSAGPIPHWERAVGQSGWAQRLYAGTEAADLAINVGMVKLFEIPPNRDYTLSIWVNASDSSGSLLTNPNPDPGPMIQFGVDPSAQTLDSTAQTIQWNSDPTQYFSTLGNENTWQQFSTAQFRTTTDTVSVWLWVQGDRTVGVSALFDDLTLNTNVGSSHWELYR